MERRKSELSLYIATGIISLFIFFSGLFIGLYFFDMKVGDIEGKNKGIDRLFKNGEVESLLLIYAEKNNSCDFLKRQSDDIVKGLSEVESMILTFENERNIDKTQLVNLKSDYTLESLKYFIFVNKLKEECGLNSAIVLYFYNNNCSTCNEEGFILTYYKLILKNDILVFSIDTDLDMSSIGILKNLYNVSTYPTIVTNGKVNEGFLDKEGFNDMLCKNSNLSSMECLI